MKPPQTTEIEHMPIGITEVTLRDGMQQNGLNTVTIGERLDVMESLIDSGMRRLEIGHLGNGDGGDIAFAEQITQRVLAAEAAGDSRYDDVEFQVLFGSQQHLMAPGVAAIEGLDKDRVIVHPYDRLSPNLRALAESPYSSQESAQRIIDVAKIAYDHGFQHFSISGEGATDPDLSPEEIVEFYCTIVDALQAMGAASVNCNLAITFGDSTGDDSMALLKYFNYRVKNGRENVTTSIHPHNDGNDSVGYSLEAIRAGFDRIEGTMIGMGERSGNVPIVDVIQRLLENARKRIDAEDNGRSMQQIGGFAIDQSIWKDRILEPSVVAGLPHLHNTSEHISSIFGPGARARFEKTSLGSTTAYDAGSGPHAHANRAFLRDPVGKPLWRNYGRIAIEHAIMGRPEAIQIIQVDPERIKEITIATHAAGTSTREILAEKIEITPKRQRAESEARARAYMARIVERTLGEARPTVLSSDPDVRAFQLGTLEFDIAGDDWMSPSRRRAVQGTS